MSVTVIAPGSVPEGEEAAPPAPDAVVLPGVLPGEPGVACVGGGFTSESVKNVPLV
jgi:hypothetical protein